MDKRIELETQPNRTRPEKGGQGMQNKDITGNKKDRDRAGCIVVVGRKGKGVRERQGCINSRIRVAVWTIRGENVEMICDESQVFPSQTQRYGADTKVWRVVEVECR